MAIAPTSDGPNAVSERRILGDHDQAIDGTVPNAVPGLEERATADAGFIELLERSGSTLVCTFGPSLVGCFSARGGALLQSFTHMPKSFGISYQNGRLAISISDYILLYRISRRVAAQYPGCPGEFDGVFVQTGALNTGPCSVHDLVLDGPDAIFINTLYSCVARTSLDYSFIPLWRPGFISALMPEDRCHLNSFAIEGGQLRYVTAFAATDAPGGYRDLPPDRGLLLEVPSGRVVLDGLIRPHSARLFNDRLFVLNSGAGEVLVVNQARGAAEVLTSLPGFTRGLFGLGEALLVGVSRTRDSAIGLDLPIGKHALTCAMVAAVDRNTGARIGRIEFPERVHEVLDFTLVPGLRSGALHPLASPDLVIDTPEMSLWARRPE